MATVSELMTFAELVMKRQRSKQDYIRFQEYQGKLILKELKQRGVRPGKIKLLELGCGNGGYSKIFDKEFKELIIADISKPKELLKTHPHIKFLQFDATKPFPIKDKSFDMVFCSSTIEHVTKPVSMLNEIYRVLRDNGKLMLSFPPFYSPVGGHQFKPFHYLGEKLAVSVTNAVRGTKIESYEKAFGTWGLYPLTIKQVKRMLIKSGFIVKDQWVRYLPFNFSKIPLLGELLTWHVNFSAVKERK